MIPVRLKMRNFLPYRGDIAPFSFEGIRLACISGENGAGKTSIIDALTWALWGKSRLRSKSTTDDDLITQGENDTEVAFDFRAGDGQIYRVVRRRTKPKRAGGAGQSSLSLFLDSAEGYKTCSGNTISETEDKIKKILHLDYDTFVSSAYLKQGEADHFTELRPNERKEVLVSILGLDIYDELAEKAKAKANEAAASKNMLATSIELEQKQLERRPELESSLAAAQRELVDNQTALLEKRVTLDGMRAARQLIESGEHALRLAEAAVREIEYDLKARRSDQADTEKRISVHWTVLTDRVRIEDGYTRYLAARQRLDDFNRKLGELRQLEKRRQSHENTITEARHALERTRDRWQVVFDELSIKAAKLDSLTLSLDAFKLETEKLAAREQQIEAEMHRLQALKIQLSAIDSEEAGQIRRLAEIAERSGLLASAGEAAACPVCEAELKEDRLKLVQAKYQADRAGTELRLGDLAASKADKKNEITALERHMALEGMVKTDRARITSQQARLEKEIEEAETAAGRLLEGERKIASITQQIDEGNYASDERKTLEALDDEISRLGYDAAAHEQVAAEVKSLEPFERRQRELAEAEKLLVNEEAASGRLAGTIVELDERLDKRLKEIQNQQAALAKLPRMEAGELAAAEAEVKVLAAAASAASEQVGSLKQSLQHLEDLEKKLAAKAAELKRHAADESIYKELQAAFGKNGIQAVLIENAIPEMEAEANRLLAKMTDNRMSLKIEPQRVSKKGDMIDTFDIKIGDELGTRDYDLFSGGEAFRINFALRLALSRLLAHRAGAPLRTLIIDEGFGTQDAAGIEKLKEAISSIQDQFDCILVITHIEEFKDAFPVRIEVFKTAEGSNIRVSYN